MSQFFITYKLNEMLFMLLQEFSTIDGARLPRCNQQNRYLNGNMCGLEFIINPDNEFRKILDLALSKSKEGRRAVQMKPQRVSLKLRASKFQHENMNFY